ncbi:MAG: hypothetical protein ABWW69_00085 [Pyrodictiaceae archaeon]
MADSLRFYDAGVEIAAMLLQANIVTVRECINCADSIRFRGDRAKLVIRDPCGKEIQATATMLIASRIMWRARLLSRVLSLALAIFISVLVILAGFILLGSEELLALVTTLGLLASIVDHVFSRRLLSNMTKRPTSFIEPPRLLVDILEPIVRAYCSKCRVRPQGFKCIFRGRRLLLSRGRA